MPDFMQGLAAKRRFAPLFGGAKWMRSTSGPAGRPARYCLRPPAAPASAARPPSQSPIPDAPARSAVTAGSACRISPMAPSRTTSKRNLDCVCKLRFSHSVRCASGPTCASRLVSHPIGLPRSSISMRSRRSSAAATPEKPRQALPAGPDLFRGHQRGCSRSPGLGHQPLPDRRGV